MTPRDPALAAGPARHGGPLDPTGSAGSERAAARGRMHAPPFDPQEPMPTGRPFLAPTGEPRAVTGNTRSQTRWKIPPLRCHVGAPPLDVPTRGPRPGCESRPAARSWKPVGHGRHAGPWQPCRRGHSEPTLSFLGKLRPGPSSASRFGPRGRRPRRPRLVKRGLSNVTRQTWLVIPDSEGTRQTSPGCQRFCSAVIPKRFSLAVRLLCPHAAGSPPQEARAAAVRAGQPVPRTAADSAM